MDTEEGGGVSEPQSFSPLRATGCQGFRGLGPPKGKTYHSLLPPGPDKGPSHISSSPGSVSSCLYDLPMSGSQLPQRSCFTLRGVRESGRMK